LHSVCDLCNLKTTYGCSQGWSRLNWLFGEANFKVSEEYYDKVYGKDRELLLYFDALVDSEPVDVKVIQRHKGCVEVSRDLDSRVLGSENQLNLLK
jgi:hypothetical protein